MKLRKNIQEGKHAPYVYTLYGEHVSQKYGIMTRLEGEPVFFGFEPLEEGDIADTWLKLGLITKADNVVR